MASINRSLYRKQGDILYITYIGTSLAGIVQPSSRQLVEGTFIEPKQPLNVVLLSRDDWRHDSKGIAGTQMVQAPFLDRL